MMTKTMLKVMTGLESIKPIEGTLVMEANGKEHNVNFDHGTLRIDGPYAEKLGKALGLLGGKLVLKEKGDNHRVYVVKED